MEFGAADGLHVLQRGDGHEAWSSGAIRIAVVQIRAALRMRRLLEVIAL